MDFYSIASGSSGNCIYIGSDQTCVLIDAGISCKRITDALKLIDRRPEDISAILVTHEHSDHISGLGVLSRKAHIPVYATAATTSRRLPSGLVGAMRPCLRRDSDCPGMPSKFMNAPIVARSACRLSRSLKWGVLVRPTDCRAWD